MTDPWFLAQAPMYYRGANAALLLYDITNAATFEDVRGWLEGWCFPFLCFGRWFSPIPS